MVSCSTIMLDGERITFSEEQHARIYVPDVLPGAVSDAQSEYALVDIRGNVALKPRNEIGPVLQGHGDTLCKDSKELYTHIANFASAVATVNGGEMDENGIYVNVQDAIIGSHLALTALSETSLPHYRRFVERTICPDMHVGGMTNLWHVGPDVVYGEFEKYFGPQAGAREVFDAMQLSYRRVGFAWMLTSVARFSERVQATSLPGPVWRQPSLDGSDSSETAPERPADPHRTSLYASE